MKLLKNLFLLHFPFNMMTESIKTRQDKKNI